MKEIGDHTFQNIGKCRSLFNVWGEKKTYRALCISEYFGTGQKLNCKLTIQLVLQCINIMRYMSQYIQQRVTSLTRWNGALITEVQSYQTCYSMRLLQRHLHDEMDCQAMVVNDDTKELCYHLEQEGEQGFQVFLTRIKMTFEINKYFTPHFRTMG